MYERFCERNKRIDRHPGHIVNDYYPRVVTEKDYKQFSYSQYVNEIKNRGMDRFDIRALGMDYEYLLKNNYIWDETTMR